MWRRLRLSVIIVLLAGTLLPGGCCLVGSEYQVNESIGQQRVERIKPGETSVNGVLTRIGPPSAIARHGRPLIIPSLSGSGEGALELQADDFFELFAARRELRSDDAVYYYDATRLDRAGGVLVLILLNGVFQTDSVHTERLWLLVNEKSGIVEAYAYREDGRTVYGDGPLGIVQPGRSQGAP